MNANKLLKKEDDTSDFIECVREYQYLFDKESHDFKNKQKKATTWSELAGLFQLKG